MKKTVLLLAYLTALVVTPYSAIAAPRTTVSPCYNVHDSDARSMCLARAHGTVYQCYSIRNPDLRQQCLSEPKR